MKWAIHVGEDGIHVVPIRDTEEHYITIDCLCEPEIRTEKGTPIFIHNAYDGREVVEQAEVIINGESNGS